jgi:hypothetical protein
MNTNQLIATAVSSANAIANATVFVRIERTPSRTVYHLTGKEAAVRCKVEKLMNEYNPWGYGTSAVYSETGAVVSRANSCG